MNLNLLDFNSDLWELYRCSYGNIVENIKILYNTSSNNEDYQVAFENICQSLYHQLSFYNATYIAMPYLVKILEKKQLEFDYQWQFNLISELGTIIMTDIPFSNNQKISIDNEIIINYNNSISILKDKVKVFIKENLNKLRCKNKLDLSYFAISVLAIYGEKEIAYILNSYMFNDYHVLCNNCNFYDENILDLSKKIIPAQSVIGKWDYKSYNNVYIWFSNFLHILECDEYVEKLRYYYGTYICPNCGSENQVMELAKNYLFYG